MRSVIIRTEFHFSMTRSQSRLETSSEPPVGRAALVTERVWEQPRQTGARTLR